MIRADEKNKPTNEQLKWMNAPLELAKKMDEFKALIKLLIRINIDICFGQMRASHYI
jgi:hypothetical protein